MQQTTIEVHLPQRLQLSLAGRRQTTSTRIHKQLFREVGSDVRLGCTCKWAKEVKQVKVEQVRWVLQLADYLLLPTTDSLPPFSPCFNPRPPLLINPNTHRADPLILLHVLILTP